MKNFKLIRGDITKMKVDAIVNVNAANTGLRGGGGVDGAIHQSGGPKILEACRKIGGCPTGEAVITTAGNLPSKFVIHTVGSVWSGGKRNEANLLANAYKNSLHLAKKNLIKSIAFPNISTGIYGFPKEKAAKIAIHECQDFIKNHESDMVISFVCFDAENYQLYRSLLNF